MQSVKSVVPFLLLAACAPQSATLTSGSYVAFFSDGTSLSLAKEEVVAGDERFLNAYDVDCRDFSEDPDSEALLRLEDPIPCGGDLLVDPQGGPNEERLHEVWITQAGFRAVHEEMEPWRGEAIIGAEGDLQIGFHHRMPGGADFRFLFAVDPDFQPTTCEPGADGTVVTENLDGEWLLEWSKELNRISNQDADYRLPFAHMEDYLEGGQLFFLNGGSYQVNPRDVQDAWVLPDQYEAGATRGKIAEELLFQRQSVWAYPRVYAQVDDASGSENYLPFNEQHLWWCELDEGDDPSSDSCAPASSYADMDDLRDKVNRTAEKTYEELRRVFRPVNGEDPIFHYRPITHLNRWRTPDGVPAGFDGWGEMHYSYVVFSADSQLEVGGRAEGAFSLALEAIDSHTKVFIQGTFLIEKIRQDRWVTEDLRAQKAEENGVELCFQQ